MDKDMLESILNGQLEGKDDGTLEEVKDRIHNGKEDKTLKITPWGNKDCPNNGLDNGKLDGNNDGELRRTNKVNIERIDEGGFKGNTDGT